jgi:hypothetical protein
MGKLVQAAPLVGFKFEPAVVAAAFKSVSYLAKT